MDVDYRKRLIDVELAMVLQVKGIVLLEGPRACGKTATTLEHSASLVKLDTDQNALQLAEVDPQSLLQGVMPRGIDEWQLAPQLWNYARHEVDALGSNATYIFTGSAVPADDNTRHSGAGRAVRLRMRPMSLFESGLSAGEVSLHELVRQGTVPKAPRKEFPLDDVIEAICRGGWPGMLSLPLNLAQRRLRGYMSEVARVDIQNADKSTRNPIKVAALLASLGRNVGTEASKKTILEDVGDLGPETYDTLASYVSDLERIFVLEPLPAWPTHMRSKSVAKKSSKWHFVDPSLAVAAVDGTPEKLRNDLNYVGFLFESLVIRDLRIYSQVDEGKVWHYRDSSGLEVDAIVSYDYGQWAAIEVKLGFNQVDAAAANLLKFASKVDDSKMGKPGALIVVVPGGWAYTREDGVHVVPINHMRN
ncbi:MAG: DUF4143 domain-containing protein [Aurantimicrobium sp.]|uniref:ATP-binding protein n=3 Tax=Aurantimicrobium sp. TaxID=1930784 RepID=UPI002FC95DDB